MKSPISEAIRLARRGKTRLSGRVRTLRRAHLDEVAMLASAPWGDPAAMDALRRQRLAATLAHARGHSPFYRELLEAAPADPLAAFAAMPVTNKDDLLASNLERATPPAPGEVRLTGSTSGSSGQPFSFQIDEGMPTRHAAQRAFIYQRAGMPRGASLLEIIPGKRLKLEPDLTYPSFPRRVVGYAAGNLAQHVHAVRPQLLFGNRSHLLQAAEECTAQGLELTIPYLCSSSETMLDRDRQLLHAAFGCEIFEVYGSAEASNIAYTTPDDPLWTMLEPRIWVEVLDRERNPVPVGEVGELVITTLTETTAPFLRYATGDLARVGAGDAAGASGLRLSSLEGRSSDSIVDAEGKTLTFWAIGTAKFWGRDDIAARVARWQIHQAEDRSLAISLELHEHETLESVESAILDFVSSIVGPLPAHIRVVAQIHDPAAGKFRAVTSKAR